MIKHILVSVCLEIYVQSDLSPSCYRLHWHKLNLSNYTLVGNVTGTQVAKGHALIKNKLHQGALSNI